jgi:hypothetical protein
MADTKPGQADEQLDPATERVRRKLVRFMAINLGILFVALMAVVIAIVYRAFWSEDPRRRRTWRQRYRRRRRAPC